MKNSLVLLLGMVVLTGCSSTQEKFDVGDNMMFMENDVVTPSTNVSQQAEPEHRTTKQQKVIEEKRVVTSQVDSNNSEKEVTVKIDKDNDTIEIKSASNNRVKEWKLNGVDHLHNNNYQAIATQAPKSDRQELVAILSDIEVKPHAEQTIEDNVMFMETGQQRYVIKKEIEVDSDISTTKKEQKSVSPEPLTTIIIDLIQTAKLSDADKEQIRKALEMN